ncbi:MAG TPA: sigma-70 family RNA polymerase sigma factor [Acidobacteriaceae bacterium]|nr:sigma-70 family RNA polymerase sigma factor [Acidobacteriaceae bacterium]
MRPDWTSPERFEVLVREHQTAVFRTLHRLTGPGAHVEDLAQEVFLRLFRALPEFRGDAQLSTYLYRITVNVAQDEWKRRRRDREHLAPIPTLPDNPDPNPWLENQPPGPFAGAHTRTPEQILSDHETQRAVEAALLTLPEIERAVLVLYHQEELSYEGIAAILNLPLNTVRTHLHRGRKRLAGLVQQRLAAPGRPIPCASERRAG